MDNPQSAIQNPQSSPSRLPFPAFPPPAASQPLNPQSPDLSALPTPEDIAAIRSLDQLGRAARLFDYYESSLERRAAADLADGKLPAQGDLNNQIMGLWRLTAVRKTLWARLDELEARQAAATSESAMPPNSPSSSPSPSQSQSASAIPHSAIHNPQSSSPPLFTFESLHGTYRPRPDSTGHVHDETQDRSTLRGWLRAFSGSVHLDPLEKILRVCAFEAWKDLNEKDPARLARMHPVWKGLDSGKAPNEFLLMHWAQMRAPHPKSPDYEVFTGLNSEGDMVVWPVGADPLALGPSDPSPSPAAIQSPSPEGTVPVSSESPSPSPSPSCPHSAVELSSQSPSRAISSHQSHQSHPSIPSYPSYPSYPSHPSHSSYPSHPSYPSYPPSSSIPSIGSISSIQSASSAPAMPFAPLTPSASSIASTSSASSVPSLRSVPACPAYSEPALARAFANTHATLIPSPSRSTPATGSTSSIPPVPTSPVLPISPSSSIAPSPVLPISPSSSVPQSPCPQVSPSVPAPRTHHPWFKKPFPAPDPDSS